MVCLTRVLQIVLLWMASNTQDRGMLHWFCVHIFLFYHTSTLKFCRNVANINIMIGSLSFIIGTGSESPEGTGRRQGRQCQSGVHHLWRADDMCYNVISSLQVPGRLKVQEGDGDGSANQEYIVFDAQQVMPLCMISYGGTWVLCVKSSL